MHEINWSRVGGPWSKRSMEDGKISKAQTKVILTGNYIKQSLGLPLNPEEDKVEREFINE